MDKRKFYVNIESREISELKAGNNDEFVIYGTPNDIIELRECLEDMEHAEMGTFWRSHMPFKEYHRDEDNDAYDACLLKTYKMIYELGDETAKEHIEQMPFFDEFNKIE
ncbi:hydrolase [Aquisalibacillus elongatus]|uniref:Hydrolase n=1 Tax=Aquisalibacillus elongatus TaxID=485577 RepID=A0A3N5AZ58_9BACI|nr:hydrolase [Aquisalibacillus elongatus]RPF50277.1 hypothetical protein EDC24_2712 [Aquisalibacillus elongatus]